MEDSDAYFPSLFPSFPLLVNKFWKRLVTCSPLPFCRRPLGKGKDPSLRTRNSFCCIYFAACFSKRGRDKNAPDVSGEARTLLSTFSPPFPPCGILSPDLQESLVPVPRIGSLPACQGCILALALTILCRLFRQRGGWGVSSPPLSTASSEPPRGG